MIRQLLPISLFLPTLVFANTIGIGEYRFGPDTSQNTACEFAEQKAKEDAIIQFIGEQIESFSLKECTNENCNVVTQIFNGVEGVIKKVVSTEKSILREYGFDNCVVTLEAQVAKVKNPIVFEVQSKVNFIEGESVEFNFTSNRPGTILVFNFYDDVYHAIDSVKVESLKEAKLPSSNKKIVATLPNNLLQSKELLTFIFTEQDIKFESKYTAREMKMMLSSMEPSKKKVVYRYVTIVRKK
jgi:hypothetical protein